MTTQEVAKTVIKSSVGYCKSCDGNEQVLITSNGCGVYYERMCPKRGRIKTKIVSDPEWYYKRVHKFKPRKISTDDALDTKLLLGCPKDCGLCREHVGEICLPVFSITNDCNLNCPICFTFNRPDKRYYKSLSETEAIIDHLLSKTGTLELINITGGEPTLHPELFELISLARKKGVNRITMNSNGIRIANDMEFAKKIRDAGVQVVLSVDTFSESKSIIIHGADISQKKRKALARLEELNIPTTILSVCIKDVNESDVQEVVKDYFSKDFVRSMTIQNMTFTGKNGDLFSPRTHITIDEVERLVCGVDGFSQEDFFSLGSYHPLCYSVAYYIFIDDKVVPLSKLVSRDLLTKATEGAYILSPDVNLSAEFRQGLDSFWANGGDDSIVKGLRSFIEKLYPSNKSFSNQERKSIIEQSIKALYIHPHMDDDNFDLERVCCCGDVVPDESGACIPACSYNMLYRQKDSRFWVEPGADGR